MAVIELFRSRMWKVKPVSKNEAPVPLDAIEENVEGATQLPKFGGSGAKLKP